MSIGNAVAQLDARPCATCGNPFAPGSHNAKYCPSCKSAGKSKKPAARVRSRINTRVRLGKGMSLSLNFPLFKI